MRLLLFILTLLAATSGEALAQGTGPSIGFHNETKHGILIQGTTVVNKVPKQVGQPFLVTPGKIGFDSNVPQGTRHITIYDSSNPKVPLLSTTIMVANRDMVYTVRAGANGQIMLVHKK
jgi:hypothetical protein